MGLLTDSRKAHAADMTDEDYMRRAIALAGDTLPDNPAIPYNHTAH